MATKKLLFTPDPSKAKPVTQEQIIGIIQEMGRNYPPEYTAVIKGIVEQESGFKNIQGRVNKRDHGAFQINEDNLRRHKLDPYDPVQAAEFAFKLLDEGVRGTGSLEGGILAYNAGTPKAKQILKGKADAHPIQQKYAPQVMARVNKFQPGLFPIDKIQETANSLGYKGKTDFVALAGGKKNLSNAFFVDDPMMRPDPGIMNAVQQQTGVMPDIITEQNLGPEMAGITAPAAPPMPDLDSAAAAIQPKIPEYDDSYDQRLSQAFGMEREKSGLNKFGLPDSLLKDIRKVVENA